MISYVKIFQLKKITRGKTKKVKERNKTSLSEALQLFENIDSKLKCIRVL